MRMGQLHTTTRMQWKGCNAGSNRSFQSYTHVLPVSWRLTPWKRAPQANGGYDLRISLPRCCIGTGQPGGCDASWCLNGTSRLCPSLISLTPPHTIHPTSVNGCPPFTGAKGIRAGPLKPPDFETPIPPPLHPQGTISPLLRLRDPQRDAPPPPPTLIHAPLLRRRASCRDAPAVAGRA